MKNLQKTGFVLGAFLLCGMVFLGCSTLTTPKKEEEKIGHDPALLVQFPRELEAKYLARLDVSDPRNVVSDINSTEWKDSLYFAQRANTRDIQAEDFDSSAYSVDADAGIATLLPSAYETEPFTGRVVVKHTDGTRRLMAYVRRGRLVELGSEWDTNGTERIRNIYGRNEFDNSGMHELAQTFEYDITGTQVAHHDYRPQEEIPQPPDNNATKPPEGIPPLPAGHILVSNTLVNGLYIYSKSEYEAYDPSDLSTIPLPYTGTIVEFHDEKRTLKKREEPVSAGQHDGTVKWWHADGQVQFEAEYAKGEPQGRTAWYRVDGSMEYEGQWTDGKLMQATTWDTMNQPTGQVVDGTGQLIYYHSNGQKRLEESYLDGKLAASKWWDEEGNEVESVDPAYLPSISIIK